MDNIFNAKKHGKYKMLFQVKWKRYNKNKQWYPSANFKNAKEIMDDFYKQNPTKPRKISQIVASLEATSIAATSQVVIDYILDNRTSDETDGINELLMELINLVDLCITILEEVWDLKEVLCKEKNQANAR